MKILIHSNSPTSPTGYGQQTKHLIRILKRLGHEPVVSAFAGGGSSPWYWEDTLILPSGLAPFGLDVIYGHYQTTQPDLVLMLMDFWQMLPISDMLKSMPLAVWVPNDCSPLSKVDELALRGSGGVPIAMSEFGKTQMRNAGFEPLYAPHCLDLDEFYPPENRGELRKELGLDDSFVIGICSANNDHMRKSYPEQFSAFRRFLKTAPTARLLVHALPQSVRGWDLPELADDMGIAKNVLFSDQYAQVSGMFTTEMLRDWYGCLDVLSLCSYAEAFGVPLIEAQACGTPVITTNGSAMSELTGPGWKVKGEDFWNPVHRANWIRPDVHGIHMAYEKSYREWNTKAAQTRRERAVEFALGFEISKASAAWTEALDRLLESAA